VHLDVTAAALSVNSSFSSVRRDSRFGCAHRCLSRELFLLFCASRFSIRLCRCLSRELFLLFCASRFSIRLCRCLSRELFLLFCASQFSVGVYSVFLCAQLSSERRQICSPAKMLVKKITKKMTQPLNIDELMDG
jgi:hypothetical protein